MSFFSTDFFDNLKRALNQLYDRDKRLKLHPENFWIVEKDLAERSEDAAGDKLLSTTSHSVLANIPHTIPFDVRAKILQHVLSTQRQEYHGGYIHPIQINRAMLFEDAYNKLFMQKFNMKKQLSIKFLNELG